MPQNKRTGGKNRRKRKGDVKQTELVYKDINQEYGQVARSLGNGYMEIMCFSDNGSILRRAHIRGKMRKRVWMTAGDIVLVSIRDYQESTCDIVIKYTPDEARLLRVSGQLPNNIDINKTDLVSEDTFKFDDDNSDNDQGTGPKKTIGESSSDSEGDINIDNL